MKTEKIQIRVGLGLMSDEVKKWMADRRQHPFPNTVAIAHFSQKTQIVTLDQYYNSCLASLFVLKGIFRALFGARMVICGGGQFEGPLPVPDAAQ